MAILGGAKVSGKIGVIENLQNKVDKIIVGGAMAFTFIKARGRETGNSLIEPEMLDIAQRTRKGVRESGVKSTSQLTLSWPKAWKTAQRPRS